MKIGIIAEFNPLHTGHTYLIQEVKAQFPDASIYIIMSTYFTQRGEPSFIHPLLKTELALKNGADFVFELPPFFSTQRADIFASGAVAICKALKLDAIAFGVENLDVMGQSKDKDKIASPSTLPFLQRINAFNKSHSWQPTANNILAHFYMEAANQHYPKLTFIPIVRMGAQFSDTTLNTTFASATAIRHAIENDEAHRIATFIPYDTLYFNTYLSWNKLYLPFLHILTTCNDLEAIATIGQSGLAYRLQKASFHTTFSTFINDVKTRAYTRTSIQRALLFTLLNITQTELDTCTDTAYTLPPRLIGFNKQKSHELKHIPHTHTMHTVANETYLQTYQKFQSVYELYMPKSSHQHFPFIFDESMT